MSASRTGLTSPRNTGRLRLSHRVRFQHFSKHIWNHGTSKIGVNHELRRKHIISYHIISYIYIIIYIYIISKWYMSLWLGDFRFVFELGVFGVLPIVLLPGWSQRKTGKFDGWSDLLEIHRLDLFSKLRYARKTTSLFDDVHYMRHHVS